MDWRLCQLLNVSIRGSMTDVDVDLVLLVGIHDGCMARERASKSE